jgi:sugar phosphate permease
MNISKKLTQRNRALDKLVFAQLGMTFSTLYGTSKFINKFARDRHWNLS